ncbi:hypothetical protein D3C80_1413070 [compost metagenome]
MPFDRFEAALRHLRRQNLQRPGIGKATGQGFSNKAGIDAGLLGERHHLGNHQSVAGHDHLVAGLGHLPSPDRAHMGNPLAQGQQHRAHAFKVWRIATDHDRQTARLGPWRAT